LSFGDVGGAGIISRRFSRRFLLILTTAPHLLVSHAQYPIPIHQPIIHHLINHPTFYSLLTT
jgi:hypothetical protein